MSKWNYYEKDHIYDIVVTLDTAQFAFNLYKGLIEFNELQQKIRSDDILIDYEDLTLDPKTDYYNLGFSDSDIPDIPDYIPMTIKTPDKKETVSNYDELLEIYYTDNRFNDKLKEIIQRI